VQAGARQASEVFTTDLVAVAKKLGVDLKSIQGTGKDGIITREDVAHAGHTAGGAKRAPDAEPQKDPTVPARVVPENGSDSPV
jgi:pyruvate/2-oxoglutarate dehydrogenase complex dihydrolipoamide acyltransferase (E2) component